ncbi:MAG TPA: SHOCT domain-containing protein [Microbacterium sp.]|uniref:SHOCT domain-containing protein n=1 Tax=Microbacterium sp. TaxID=51671 RepID=UPI002B6CFB15|nr:SHOCT domain-containing protein [Microbacterium sp.]HWI31246.1 SHOCT domain-containing protein [Microbacterium sp.]
MGFWDWFAWMFWAFIYISFIFVVVFIIFDVFADHALNGWGKAGWVILICFFPILGALIYLIARGKSMAERRARGAELPREDDDYRPKVFANPADEITKAKALADQGIISQGEYEAIKAKALTATG